MSDLLRLSVKNNQFVFFIPFIIFDLLFSLPPSRNSDPGTYRWRALFPSPHYVATVRAAAFHLIGRRLEPAFFLINVRMAKIGPNIVLFA